MTGTPATEVRQCDKLLDTYRRMLRVFDPMRRNLIGRTLTADELRSQFLTKKRIPKTVLPGHRRVNCRSHGSRGGSGLCLREDIIIYTGRPRQARQPR